MGCSVIRSCVLPKSQNCFVPDFSKGMKYAYIRLSLLMNISVNSPHMHQQYWHCLDTGFLIPSLSLFISFFSSFHIQHPGLGQQLPASVQFSSVQLLSHVWLFATPWPAACPASLSITNSPSVPKVISIELVMPSNHLILCHPSLFPPSIFPSIRVFPNESALRIRWPKYWSFSFNISPSNEHSGLISFRMDWLDLLAVQGTLKSLFQHHSSKASILWCSAFFTVQLSHPYMTTGKTIALTRWTFVGKVTTPLFNVLSRFSYGHMVITFQPRSNCLLISWLQLPSAVIFEPPKIVSHCFHCFPIHLPWSDRTRCHDLSFLNIEF